ncbi:MAG TPA: alpha/beta hydrolase [Spirochaetota bacterium]|nr:alpha/beta hydrolase [Spirochaetota bacterium]
MKTAKPVVQSIIVGNTEMQYLDYGSKGPVIIMMHATGFLPWLWHPIARELSDEYRVIAPYFCDHRFAEPEEGGLSWMLMAEDLCEICKTLAIDRPYLVGHSMGATVMALANSIHHTSAEKMVLIEPIFLPQEIYRMDISVEQHPLASKSIKRRNSWDTRDDARTYLKSKKLFMKWDDEMLDLYINYGMVPGETGGLQLACHPRREAALFMGGSHYDPWPVLEKISCPVLVVEGESSENRAFIDLKKAAAMIPRGSYTLVPDAGHLIPMEQPATVVNLIREFFKK